MWHQHYWTDMHPNISCFEMKSSRQELKGPHRARSSFRSMQFRTRLSNHSLSHLHFQESIFYVALHEPPLWALEIAVDTKMPCWCFWTMRAAEIKSETRYLLFCWGVSGIFDQKMKIFLPLRTILIEFGAWSLRVCPLGPPPQ